MMPHKPSQKRWGPQWLIAAALLAGMFVLLRRPLVTEEQLPLDEPANVQVQAVQVQAAALVEEEEVLSTQVVDSPWPKLRVINDLETLWEVPPDPKGVLFVAHGCNHQGSDFWPSSSRCLHCLGLPEELRVRSTALQRGYAVIGISSFNRESKCWHNTVAAKSEDLQRVPKILRKVMQEEGLQELPLFVLGASSGGGFVLRLATVMAEVKGVTCQINPVNAAIFGEKGPEGEKGWRYPPVLFVHMAERDPEKAETVKVAMAACRKAGIPTDEIRIGPQPVTPAFMQRSPQIGSKMAAGIVEAMREDNFLDEEDFLKKDPRGTAPKWRPILQPVVGDLSLDSDVSQITELFNVAYARHELISDTTDVSLTWMEAGGKEAVHKLLEKHQQQRL